MPKGHTIYVDEEYPEIAAQFLKPEEAHVGLQSTKRVDFVCKCCSKVFNDMVRNVVRRKSTTCASCGDGVSYPEKFMSCLLDQLGIKFNMHYYANWTNGYYYDFEFTYNEQKFIIEMDGGLGHGHVGFKNSNTQKSILVDKEKDDLALSNGYKIVRVNCYYKPGCAERYEHVKSNIIKELKDLFILDNVDFEKCNSYALGSLFYEVINYYKNESKYIDDIKEKFHLKKTCIHKYLKYAMSIGILPYEYLHDFDRFKNFPVPIIRYYRDEEVRNSKIVYCYDDAIAFDSLKAVSQYLNLNPTTISVALREYNGKILGKRYCLYEDLPADFNFKPIQTLRTRYKPIYQYTMDKTQLVHMYEDKTHLLPEYDYSHIVAVCTGKRKSHKRFWWSYFNIFEKENETSQQSDVFFNL